MFRVLTGVVSCVWVSTVFAAPARPELVGGAMTLLREECLSCHNAEKARGGLRLDRRELALQGGDAGPAFVSGKAAESALVKALAREADPHMPPKKQLNDSQIELLGAWIQAGAAWDEKLLASGPAKAPAVQTLRPLPAGHQPAVALAFSPDGRLVAAGHGADVRLYDWVKTERPLLTRLSGHRDVVQSLAWSPDGKTLASGGYRRVLLWNGAGFTNRVERTAALSGRVTGLRFTKDGRELIVAEGATAQEGILHVWPLEAAAPAHTWLAHGDNILDLSMSGDGRRLATAGADKLAKLWDLETRKELARFEGHGAAVHAVALPPDATRLATAGADGAIKIWDVKTRVQKIEFTRVGVVNRLLWINEGKELVALSEDGLPRVYSDFKEHDGTQSSSGGKERKYPSVEDVLYGLAATPKGEFILAAGHSGKVFVWGGARKLEAELP